MATATRTRQPTAQDVAAAIAAMSAATTSTVKDDTLSKTLIMGISGVIGIIMVALFLWVGTSINDLSKSVTLMSANVDNLQKSITELQQGQGANSKTTSDLQASMAGQNARSGAIEADLNRVKERVRMLEGQKPVIVQ